ncbi:Fc.00g114610.m01.CDS01 [Cosmosporella sp. VM-42]
MVLLKLPPKSFTGTVLLIAPFTPPPAQIKAIRDEYPNVKLISYKLPWGQPHLGDDFPTDEWKNVKVLLTSTYLPSQDLVPNLQYVQLTSAGANHLLDKPLFKDTDVPFCTANGVHGPQISEWVITTFLAFQHHIYTYRDYQKQAKWDRNIESTEDSYGKRVGILGYGSIGRQVARVATAMGMSVHAYTLHPRSTPESRRDNAFSPPGIGDPDGIYPSKWFSGGSKEEIHEFLASDLDLLIISTPLTEKTRGLLSKPEFRVLSKKKTFVSNIARGPIVDTNDLIDALDQGVIRGAALDVTDPEPLPDGHRLWSAKNVFISPHVSGQSDVYYDRVLEILRVNLGRLSEGKDLVNKVNRNDGY